MSIQQHYFASYMLILLEFLRVWDEHVLILIFRGIISLIMNHFCFQLINYLSNKFNDYHSLKKYQNLLVELNFWPITNLFILPNHLILF
jgi:hypothetical protein